MTTQILEQFQLASDAFENLLAGVSSDQVTVQTPSCPEWTVHDLVGHVLKGNLMFIRLFTGAEPPAVDAEGDVAAAISVSTKALREAASAEGALAKTFNTPQGERNGGRLMAIRVVEFTVHGWDLAKATGQSLEVPEAIIETCFQVLKATLPEDRTGTPYGTEQPAEPGAAAIDRLAAFAGRAAV